MEDVVPETLNMESLFDRKKHVDIQTVKSYNTILARIHTRIHYSSRQRINSECCWFIVPEIMLGCPTYDVRLCIAYLVQQLQKNGFNVKYTHPNLLFICWKHYIPDYIRSEIKKQTGVQIDGFGNEVKKNETTSEIQTKALDPRFMPVTKYKPVGRFS